MANQYDTNLKLQAIADAIGDTSSSGLISALEDIADAVAGGGGGSSAGLVSDNFSETDTYDLGDYCIHNNTLYVCINAITTPGPWDLSDWQATNAGIQLSSLNSALEWKELKNDSGGSVVLPDNAKEFYCLAKFSTSGAYSQVGMFAVRGLVDGPSWHISNTYYVRFTASTRAFTVTQVISNTHYPAEKILIYWR